MDNSHDKLDIECIRYLELIKKNNKLHFIDGIEVYREIYIPDGKPVYIEIDGIRGSEEVGCRIKKNSRASLSHTITKQKLINLILQLQKQIISDALLISERTDGSFIHTCITVTVSKNDKRLDSSFGASIGSLGSSKISEIIDYFTRSIKEFNDWIAE
jgi:hypothetical protein